MLPPGRVRDCLEPVRVICSGPRMARHPFSPWVTHSLAPALGAPGDGLNGCFVALRESACDEQPPSHSGVQPGFLETALPRRIIEHSRLPRVLGRKAEVASADRPSVNSIVPEGFGHPSAIERRSACPCRQASFCGASGGKELPPSVGGSSLTGVAETMIDVMPEPRRWFAMPRGHRWLPPIGSLSAVRLVFPP